MHRVRRVHQLKIRLSTAEQNNVNLTAFRTQALSGLAAQHEEITRLRGAIAATRNVHAVHVQDNEADAKKRAFTKAELHAFFAHCDDEVARIRAFGRKGWLPAFRDATLFKTAYAYGLRRNETRMLDAADFGRNPYGGEFGEFGRCQVRFGKAKKARRPSAAEC